MNIQDLKNKVSTLLPTDAPIPFSNKFQRIACIKTTLLSYISIIEGLTERNAKQSVIDCYLSNFNTLFNEYKSQNN